MDKNEGDLQTPGQPATNDALALARIRVAVGRAVGLEDRVHFTPEQLATLAERIINAASGRVPGLCLFARDL